MYFTVIDSFSTKKLSQLLLRRLFLCFMEQLSRETKSEIIIVTPLTLHKKKNTTFFHTLCKFLTSRRVGHGNKCRLQCYYSVCNTARSVRLIIITISNIVNVIHSQEALKSFYFFFIFKCCLVGFYGDSHSEISIGNNMQTNKN